MKECKFCSDYKDTRAICKPATRAPGSNLHIKLRLVTYFTKNRKKGGQVSWDMYDINFCPVCGKKLKRTRKEAVNG